MSYHRRNLSFPNLTLVIFCITFCYWIYLAFTTKMSIIYDALGYEGLGNLIYKSGWVEFLKKGPNREPLYPFIISISMMIADRLHISYFVIQKIFQMSILLLTQWLTYKLLKKLKISPTITAITILYVGISPAIVNSAFSLYSEIAIYPFVLGIVLVSIKSWKILQKTENLHKIILWGALLGILFMMASLVKATFQAMIFIFMLPHVFLCIRSLSKSQRAIFKNSIVYILTTILTCYLGLISYMSLNLKYNGHFALADRGPWIIYGKAVQRTTVPLTPKSFFAAIAYATGEGACKNIFGEAECLSWSPHIVNGSGMGKLSELRNSQIPDSQVDNELLRLSKEKFLRKPFQYLLLTGVEGLKIFFWESTQIGFVQYPKWLEKLYSINLFKNGLRLFISFLTMIATFYSCVYTWKSRKKLYDFNSDNHEIIQALFFISIFICIYTSIYSFFLIIPRHAFALVPLFLTGIAFFLQNISSRIAKS